MNTLKLPLFLGQSVILFGGPYRQRPANMVGVKMAVEIDRPYDINVPTRDYSVPAIKDVDAGLIGMLEYLLQGREIYVGCMGGIGRTGLMLAIAAKAFGVPDPIAHVRATFNVHAVETGEQKEYVEKYKIPRRVKWLVVKLKFKRMFH